MVRIELGASYKLGLPAIDGEHQGLVDRLNAFFALADANATSDILGCSLDVLIAAAEKHFRDEENRLDRAGFPALGGHAAEHRFLIERMRHFQRPYTEGRGSREMAVEGAEFFRGWILDHIEQFDKRYVPFLKQLA